MTILIHELEIYNYRSCIKTKLEINSNLTTLIGVNGAGKSNILNSLQLLRNINYNRFLYTKTSKKNLSHSRINLLFEIDDIKYLLRSDIYYDTDENNIDEVFHNNSKIKNITANSKKWISINPRPR